MIIILIFLTHALTFVLGYAIYGLCMYSRYLELKLLIEKNKEIRARYYEYFENTNI